MVMSSQRKRVSKNGSDPSCPRKRASLSTGKEWIPGQARNDKTGCAPCLSTPAEAGTLQPRKPRDSCFRRNDERGEHWKIDILSSRKRPHMPRGYMRPLFVVSVYGLFRSPSAPGAEAHGADRSPGGHLVVPGKALQGQGSVLLFAGRVPQVRGPAFDLHGHLPVHGL